MNTETYKTKLAEELALLKGELESVGQINPSNKADWEAKQADDIEADPADDLELGDKMEEYENNTAVLKQLEIKYNKVKDALERIDAGTFGVCSICGSAIEDARLEANPSANTCIAHKEQENGIR